MPKHGNRQRSSNPLVNGVEEFLLHYSLASTISRSDLPKRYTIYEPMLLLGPTFATHSCAWQTFYESLSPTAQNDLLTSILKSFNSAGLSVSRVAMNAPILLITTKESKAGGDTSSENILRAPTGLLPLYGNFGPDRLFLNEGMEPTNTDFEQALWVSTSQHVGITQVWAPRWTMFSRGNIREKGRVLGLNPVPFAGLSNEELGQEIGEVDVVDMFVGIGYFAFSYLRRGVRRVYGWDLNAWSIEGCRRGCEKNGWGCMVFKLGGEDGLDVTCERVVQSMRSDDSGRRVRCILFEGDCRLAADVVGRLGKLLESNDQRPNVRHVNLGLLPSSNVAYESAVTVVNKHRGGWLHVHENAETVRVGEKRGEVLDSVRTILSRGAAQGSTVKCEYTEMVKTYAPGVGHYVFDIHIQPPLPAYSLRPGPPKFGGYIPLDDALLLFRQHSLLLLLHLIVHPEMLNIFRMCQIFLLCIRSVKLLKMVYLVLVLHVPVMTRAHAEIWQRHTVARLLHKRLFRYTPALDWVEEPHHFSDGSVFGVECDVLVAVVVHAVHPTDLVRTPMTIVVEVVEGEERRRVEVGYI